MGELSERLLTARHKLAPLTRAGEDYIRRPAMFALEAMGLAASTLQAQREEIERATKPITMQDVRLATGEGRLRPMDVLGAVNVVLRSRARTPLPQEGGE